MPGTNTSTNTSANYADYDDDRPPSTEQADGGTDSPKHKKQEGKKDDQSRDGKRGWFGGIFTKLSLRPPNQMILPDDKNPTIVWDEHTKRWRNLDGDGDEPDKAPPPPPKNTDLAPMLRSSSPPLQTPAQTLPPSALSSPSAPVSNIFKMQKGRHIKKSYVDVFNPHGAATRALPPAAEVLPPAPPPPPATYFVPPPAPPAPHTQGGIYDPSQMPNEELQYHSGI